MTVATIGLDGLLQLGAQRYRVALGTAGIVPHKQEGDRGTPVGLLPLRRVFYRADRLPRPRAAVPIALLAPNDGWCDDPHDPAYNRLVRLPYPARHEPLWRDDTTYDLIGVLGWNDAPTIPRAGSAVFLHIARPGLPPTEGCIALPQEDLLTLLANGLTAIEVQA